MSDYLSDWVTGRLHSEMKYLFVEVNLFILRGALEVKMFSQSS